MKGGESRLKTLYLFFLRRRLLATCVGTTSGGKASSLGNDLCVVTQRKDSHFSPV